MIIICPRCHAQLNSKNALTLHMLQAERCYPTTDDLIVDKIKERIDTLKGAVHFILIKIPATRGDDELLAHWYRTIFAKTEQYDYTIHAFRSIALSPDAIVKGVKTESVGRVRRHIQEEDRKLFHKHHTVLDEKGKTITIYEAEWTTDHLCVLPSHQTQIRRQIEFEESKQIWAAGIDNI
ncbi:MAG: hypothetical protein QW719_02860 [Candidatus Micrarchaeaceae archaeon]